MPQDPNWWLAWAFLCDPGAVAKASAEMYAADKAAQVEAMRIMAQQEQATRLPHQQCQSKRPPRRKRRRNKQRRRRGKPRLLEVRRYKVR